MRGNAQFYLLIIPARVTRECLHELNCEMKYSSTELSFHLHTAMLFTLRLKEQRTTFTSAMHGSNGDVLEEVRKTCSFALMIYFTYKCYKLPVQLEDYRVSDSNGIPIGCALNYFRAPMGTEEYEVEELYNWTYTKI